jgi:formiminotetrahydrofolate cyclodeaminase
MPEPLPEKTLKQFLDELASAAPVPGGGSVAALSGALAASLIAMVCRLTLGKKGYESVQAEMQTILERAESLDHALREQMQADIDAYAHVMQAYSLPKSTEADQAVRTETIQSALKHASEVPLRVAELCSDVLDLAQPVAEKGNKNAASDGGVGALMAEAGLRGAALNVSINLSGIKDAAFVSRYRTRVSELIASAVERKHQVLQTVEKIL